MATDDGRITAENNPTLHAKLMEMMKAEQGPTGQYPGWIAKGSLNYRVFQQADKTVAFMPTTTENLYESTSF
jgi:hypothetical protein